MENYFKNQATTPHFSSYSRQKGSGIGTLVAGIGRVAVPFARRVLWPTAKRIGTDFLMEAIPELASVASKKSTAKQSLKRAAKRTVKKQLGRGVTKRKKSKKRVHSKKRQARSRSDFFSKIKYD